MKQIFSVRNHAQCVDVVLLLLRVVTGIAFILHGWGKIQAPMSWMPGDSVPGIFQALAAISEFGGGIALIIGLVTPLASFGLFCTMIVAAIFHAVILGHPFVGQNGSWELATVYAVISLLFIVAGPGRFSLDKVIFGTK
jgi:putative oxidoreductase